MIIFLFYDLFYFIPVFFFLANLLSGRSITVKKKQLPISIANTLTFIEAFQEILQQQVFFKYLIVFIYLSHYLCI
jgi:hypothetical protein